MKFKNSKTNYGLIAKVFHWTIFIILSLQFPLGIYLDSLEFSEFKVSIENWHITIGMLIFYVTLARLIWKSLNPDPSKHNQVNNIQKYIDSFETTFNAIKNNGFENQISLLPISSNLSG